MCAVTLTSLSTGRAVSDSSDRERAEPCDRIRQIDAAAYLHTAEAWRVPRARTTAASGPDSETCGTADTSSFGSPYVHPVPRDTEAVGREKLSIEGGTRAPQRE